MDKPSGTYNIELITGAWPISPKEVFYRLLTEYSFERDGDYLVFFQDQSLIGKSKRTEIARMRCTGWEYND